MRRGKKKQMFLHVVLLAGMLVTVPFMGYAVTISTGPSTERRVETRSASRNSNEFRERKSGTDEPRSTRQVQVSKGGFIPNVLSQTSSYDDAGVTFQTVGYQPYYGYYSRDNRSCSGGCDGPTYQPPPYFRGNPAVYQNYYMYHNFNYGW